MAGYKVLKLEPSTLDRLSAYGHDAVFDEAEGVWVATEDAFAPAEWVVHDAGMQISVQNLDTGAVRGSAPADRARDQRHRQDRVRVQPARQRGGKLPDPVHQHTRCHVHGY